MGKYFLRITKTLVFALVFTCFYQEGLSQMQVEEAIPPSLYDPINLIENVFLGDGVEVTAINYDGNNNAVGFFKDGIAQVGMERGIVMSSGFAGSADDPNDSPNTSGMTSGSSLSDPDLAALTTVGLRDISRYEITFIPISDTLRFKYAFASEEYPEYTCSSFNDVFGFFITGPNPAGGNYVSENIALVPDPNDPSGLTFTNVSVAINNVHNGNPNNPNCVPAYPEYYNTNPGGAEFLTFDGILDVFVAQAIVIPCEEYTIKLAIADGSDQIYDSAVFMEAKSFGTGSLDVKTETVSLDGSIAEGCDGGKIILSLPNPVDEDYVVNANLVLDPAIGNLAENGIDYNQIDFPIIIPKDSSSVEIEIFAYPDGIDEGEEFIAIEIQKDVCNLDTVYILVRENLLVTPILPDDVTICTGEDHLIDTELDPNFFLPPPPTFSNSNNLSISPEHTGIFSDIEVIGVAPDILSADVIKKVCIDTIIHRYLNDIDLFLISPGGQFLELSTDNGFKPLNGQDVDTMINTCFTVAASGNINNGNGLIGDIDPANPTYTGDYAPEGVWSDLWDGEFPTNGTWRLMMIDDETGFIGQFKGWSMCFNSVYNISYEWGPDDGTIDCLDCPDIIVNPDTTTTYVLTTSDTYGCSVTDSMTVYVDDNAIDVLTLDQQDVSCFGDTDGSIQVEASGDFPPFNYELNGVSNQTGIFENLGSGQYTIFVSDIKCTVSYEIEIGTPDEMLATPALGSGILCSGDNSGTAAFEISGGTAPFSFSWENGVMDSINLNLIAGDYDVTITDANDCVIVDTYSFSEPDPMLVSIIFDDLFCFEDNSGTAIAETDGGVEPYTYLWSDPLAQDLMTAVNLSAGSVTVTVTDVNNCTATQTVVINEPDAISLQMNAEDVLCQGESNGIAFVIPDGGVADYQFEWSNGIIGDSQIEDLLPGWYTVTVTDNNNCESIDSIEVGTVLEIVVDAAISDVLCFGENSGQIILSPSGGTGTITALWDDGEIGYNKIDIGAGTYCVTLTDGNNCELDSCFTVMEPEVIEIEFEPIHLDCFEDFSGGINSNITGGVEPYTYLWQGPNSYVSGQQNIAGIEAGMYILTIIDANLCESIDSVEVLQPDELYIEVFTKDVQCFGDASGELAITIFGGIDPFGFNWTGPDNFSSTEEDIEDLLFGTYSLTVTDGNGCTFTLSEQVEQPSAPLLANVSSPDTICNDALKGKVQTSPSGGVGPYNIEWSTGDPFPLLNDLPGGAYTVTITDAQNCVVVDTAYIEELGEINIELSSISSSCTDYYDGTATIESIKYGNELAPVSDFSIIWNSAPLQFTEMATGLKGGETYQVIVTDKFGCSGTASVIIDNPLPIQAEVVDFMDVNCFEGSDGFITVQGEDGKSPYSYAWGPATNFQQGPTATDLKVGEYFVTVTDANGCTGVHSYTLKEPPLVEFDFRKFDVFCHGGDNGELKVIANGGTVPYSYNWSNGATSDEITNLTSGIYILTLTDARGCTFIDSAFVEEPEFPLEVNGIGLDVSCFDGQDGIIQFDAIGGNGFYVFSVDGINYSGALEQVGLSAGEYTIYVKDLKGCIDSFENVVVFQPPPINVELGPDITVNIGDQILLEPGLWDEQGTVIFDWNSVDIANLTCDDCENPTVTVLNQMTLELIVQDENNCFDKDYLNIYIENDNAVFVPTGFTPNGDTNNDVLNVFGIDGVHILEFKIYDRWGELMFEAEDFDVNDLEIGWDGSFRGSPMNAGVFVWYAEAEFVSGHKKIYKGHFTLLR